MIPTYQGVNMRKEKKEEGRIERKSVRVIHHSHSIPYVSLS
jgi:hypothetical protein